VWRTDGRAPDSWRFVLTQEFGAGRVPGLRYRTRDLSERTSGVSEGHLDDNVNVVIVAPT
jgi:hypothetical protein